MIVISSSMCYYQEHTAVPIEYTKISGFLNFENQIEVTWSVIKLNGNQRALALQTKCRVIYASHFLSFYSVVLYTKYVLLLLSRARIFHSLSTILSVTSISLTVSTKWNQNYVQ